MARHPSSLSLLAIVCSALLGASLLNGEVIVVELGPESSQRGHRVHHRQHIALGQLLNGVRAAPAAAGARAPRGDWPAHAVVTAPGHPATVVTALYDIGRAAKGDGRSMDQYKAWFSETLSILAPMVVFVGDEELAEFVKARRTGHAPTRVVMLPFEHLPLASTVDIVGAAQRSREWTNCSKDRGRLENKLPEYIVLVNSKPQLLAWAAEANPFDSEYFFFLDAGIARWSAAITKAAGVRRPFPNMTKVREFDPEGNRFLAQSGLPDPDNLKIPNVDDWFAYCCGPGNGFNGGVLGGSGATVKSMARDHLKMFLHEVLPAQAVANEQMLLTIMYNRDAARFKEIPYKCPEPGCAEGRVDAAISAIDWLA